MCINFTPLRAAWQSHPSPLSLGSKHSSRSCSRVMAICILCTSVSMKGFPIFFDKSRADSLSFEWLAAVQIHCLPTRCIYIVGRRCFAVCTTGLCTGFYPHSRCYTSLTLQTYGCCTAPILHCHCRSTACWQLMETANEPLLSEAPSANIWPSRCSKQLGKPFPKVSLLKMINFGSVSRSRFPLINFSVFGGRFLAIFVGWPCSDGTISRWPLSFIEVESIVRSTVCVPFPDKHSRAVSWFMLIVCLINSRLQ